mmetsp:Transcript_37405/g.86939  ORF Transcript_37405/g.86939 Transcript_37405/m.86939 type:complete len:219 (+) Transcript_37405:245-901(+)
MHQRLLRRHATEGQDGLQPIVAAKEDVCVEAISHHADALAARNREFLLQVVNHKGAGLAHNSGLLACAALDGADHGAVASPLLRIRQVGDLIGVCRNELATAVLGYAELCVLDFVVVDVAIKTNNDCTNVRILVDLPTGTHVRHHVLVTLRAKPRYAYEIQLLANALLTNNICLLASVLELCLLQVGCSCKGGGEDLLWWHVETQRVELCLVALSALG